MKLFHLRGLRCNGKVTITMIRIILKIMPKVKSCNLMAQALASIMFKTKLERGCIDCQYYAERENPRLIRYAPNIAGMGKS